ncbi:MAG: dTMP kinase [Thermoprotei archaeon]|nr:dTMP kinase [TACK group archaeon]
MRGLFVTIEGIDGCGKTTQARLLHKRLLRDGIDTVLTHEPTDGQIGRLIQKLLKGQGEVPAKLLALLFAADRYDHVEKLIRPALQSGKIVICDRYYHSSIAYQSSMGVDEAYVKCINDFALKPDLAILLRISAKTATARVTKRKHVQYTEQETLQTRVQQKYEQLCREGELIPIDAEGNRADVQRKIWALVSEKLSERHVHYERSAP